MWQSITAGWWPFIFIGINALIIHHFYGWGRIKGEDKHVFIIVCVMAQGGTFCLILCLMLWKFFPGFTRRYLVNHEYDANRATTEESAPPKV